MRRALLPRLRIANKLGGRGHSCRCLDVSRKEVYCTRVVVVIIRRFGVARSFCARARAPRRRRLKAARRERHSARGVCAFLPFFSFFLTRASIIIITRERERERTREGCFFQKVLLHTSVQRERERERETCLSHATPSSSSVLSRVSVFSFTRSVSLLTEFLSRDYFSIYIARVSSYNESTTQYTHAQTFKRFVSSKRKSVSPRITTTRV